MFKNIMVKLGGLIGLFLGVLFALYITEPEPIDCEAEAANKAAILGVVDSYEDSGIFTDPVNEFLNDEHFTVVSDNNDLCPVHYNAISMVKTHDEQGNYILVLGDKSQVDKVAALLPFRYKLHYCEIEY